MLQRRGTKGAGLSDDQLCKAYEGQLAKVERWIDDQPNFEVLFVSYNGLVAEPGPAAEAVNAFLDDRLDVAAMVACVDPALYRQRGEAGP